MGVRFTESRIPDGFTEANAKKLGYSTMSGNYALISYLDDTFSYGKIGDEIKHYKNEYVVFVNTAAGNAVRIPSQYTWRVKYYEIAVEGGEEQLNNFKTIESIQDGEDAAIYYLDTEDVEDDLNDKNPVKIEVLVELELSGDKVTLKLSHENGGLNGTIEALIAEANQPGVKSSIAGDLVITRLIGNDFRSLLSELDIKKIEQEFDGISINLAASMLYNSILGRDGEWRNLPGWIFDTGQEEWMKYINSNFTSQRDELINAKVGILDLKPHLVNHYVPQPRNFVDAFVFDPQSNETLKEFERRIILHFHQSLDENEKINLVNRLRFPKSCIELAWKYLVSLKNRHDEFSEHILNKDNHLRNRDCVRTIVSEYETVPHKSALDITGFSKKAYDIMYSPWMQSILESNYIQYETLKIKILDIRSGKPIPNAPVRKVAFKISGHSVGRDKDIVYKPTNRNTIRQADSVIMKAQKALNNLGYDHGNPGNTFFQAGKTQYNNYWRDRFMLSPSGPIDEITEDNVLDNQPPEYILREIIQDYLHHKTTGSDRVLTVRIPRLLLDNNHARIEISMWEFPLLVEELKDNNTPFSTISRSASIGDIPAEEKTDFKISWIGEQSLDFAASVEGEQHFGWQVTSGSDNSNLRVAVPLTVKIDLSNFEGFDRDLLSKYYDPEGYPYHFVLFGMQWCQPVWDEFYDSSESAIGAITNHTYVQDPRFNNLHMHLVTIPYPMSGTDLYGGKGYGRGEDRVISRWRPNTDPDPDHWGLDIHARVGDLVFAAHWGTVYRIDSPSAGDWVGHKSVAIRWPPIPGAVRNACAYKHLNSHNMNVDDRVVAGQILGKAGRTGNLDMYSYQPTHVHLDTGVEPDERILLRETPDDNNKITIPFNEYPLVFPCSCQVTNAMGTDEATVTALTKTTADQEILAIFPPTPRPADQSYAYIDCRFHNNSEVVNRCWAAAELKCPYIDPNDKGNIKLQVQLRHIKQITDADPGGFTDDEANNPEYFNPGSIDGGLGDPRQNINVNDLDVGDVVERITDADGNPIVRHDGKLIKVKFTQDDGVEKEGWIESSLIDHDNKWKNNVDRNGNALGQFITNPAGKSRMAIYMFKKVHNLLDFANYASNFSIDDDAWDELDRQAPIIGRS